MAKQTETRAADTGAMNSKVTKTAAEKTAARNASQSKPQYSAAELASAARARFGVPPEMATAALRTAGKQKATLTEAQSIIEKFTKREVN